MSSSIRLKLVSFFSERRYPSLWRHMQSLRDADNPFGRFRHVTGFPEELTRSRALVGDERPGSTVRLASLIVDSLYYLSTTASLSRCPAPVSIYGRRADEEVPDNVLLLLRGGP